MLASFFLFLFGIIALISGAKLLILGATQLAATFKVPPLVIGLTVVAFGTSTPEVGVSTLAAWRGEGDLAIGTVVGSNILNILLILGICATIVPLVVKKQLIRWDVPFMIVVTFFFWLFALNKKFSTYEGIFLLGGLALYCVYLAYLLRRDRGNHEPYIVIKHPLWLQCIWIIIGLVLLGYGSDWLIKGVTNIATYFQINELFIALTVVALGTSLPELATSVTAAIKGHKDIAVGNIIGSNIFNLLGVFGIAAIIAPDGIEIPQTALSFDIPVMMAVTLASLPIFLTGHVISRWEGVLFLFYYLLYTLYLLLNTLHYPILPLFSTAFFFFILPLTVITLAIGLYRHFRLR